MVRRTTWILLIIFALLVGFAFLFQRYQSNKAKVTETGVPTATPGKLYSFSTADLTSVSMEDNKGNSIDLYFDPASSKWTIKDVPVDQVDSTQIENAISQLVSIQVKETLTQSVSLNDVGLATPVYTITMTTTAGTQVITYVGSPNAIGDGHYARVDSGPVVIVDKTVMDMAINFIKTPPLLPTPTPKVTATESGTPIAPEAQTTPTP